MTNDETLSRLQVYWDCTEGRDFVWNNQTYTVVISSHWSRHWKCREHWGTIEDCLTYMVVIFSVLQVALGM